MIRTFLLLAGASFAIALPQYIPKIVGGTTAYIEDHPHQLSLSINGKHSCGAVLVSQKFALTSAQCVNGFKPYEVTIRAGSSLRNSGGIVKTAKSLTIHPKYDEKTLDYDIAIIELASPLPYKDEIKNITLASEEPLAESPVHVTGWGAEDDGVLILPLQLQGVGITVVDRDYCQERLAQNYKVITERMICAGNVDGRRDACQGDAGGPLVDENGVLVGLVSYGIGCGRRNTPSVYTNVAALRDWVFSNIQV